MLFIILTHDEGGGDCINNAFKSNDSWVDYKYYNLRGYVICYSGM